MRILIAVVMFCAPLLLAQNSEQAAIRAVREQSNRAIRRHDMKTFAASLTSDFVMVRGSGAFVASRDAYVQLFREDGSNPGAAVYQRTPDKIDISTAAPLAAEEGHWVGLVHGKPAYSGSYLAQWRREADGWKIRSELFVLLSCQDRSICSDYASQKK
jgi:ketosteroid isomerase-like protein